MPAVPQREEISNENKQKERKEETTVSNLLTSILLQFYTKITKMTPRKQTNKTTTTTTFHLHVEKSNCAQLTL